MGLHKAGQSRSIYLPGMMGQDSRRLKTAHIQYIHIHKYTFLQNITQPKKRLLDMKQMSQKKHDQYRSIVKGNVSNYGLNTVFSTICIKNYTPTLTTYTERLLTIH